MKEDLQEPIFEIKLPKDIDTRLQIAQQRRSEREEYDRLKAERFLEKWDLFKS